MRYVCLIYDEEKRAAGMSKAEGDALMGEYFAFTEGIKKSGQYIGGEALQPEHDLGRSCPKGYSLNWLRNSPSCRENTSDGNQENSGHHKRRLAIFDGQAAVLAVTHRIAKDDNFMSGAAGTSPRKSRKVIHRVGSTA